MLLNLLVNAGDALEGAGRGARAARGAAGGGQRPGFTTKGPEKGTGLGLSISRELVERFGGTLDAENRPEGGARLRIELPTHVPGRAEGGQARLAG